MSFRRISSAAFHEMRSAAPVFVREGKFLAAAIMREGVRIARQCRSPHITWARCMRTGLTSAWKAAKAAMEAAVEAPRPAKLDLDRRGALVVLDAIQHRTVNHGRDIGSIAGCMSDLADVLAHACAEFRKLSDADRAAVMEVARGRQQAKGRADPPPGPRRLQPHLRPWLPHPLERLVIATRRGSAPSSCSPQL